MTILLVLLGVWIATSVCVLAMESQDGMLSSKSDWAVALAVIIGFPAAVAGLNWLSTTHPAVAVGVLLLLATMIGPIVDGSLSTKQDWMWWSGFAAFMIGLAAGAYWLTGVLAMADRAAAATGIFLAAFFSMWLVVTFVSRLQREHILHMSGRGFFAERKRRKVVDAALAELGSPQSCQR